MHHPGPPRFVAVGETFELAPRDPDPDATYTWRLTGAPTVSSLALGDDPVEHVTPDAPGTYRFELDAPDGTHTLTVRVFGEGVTPGGPSTGGTSGGSSMSGWSGRSEAPQPTSGRSGSARGSASGATAEDSDTADRPRLQLHARVVGDTVIVEGESTDSSATMHFLVDDRDDLGREAVAIKGDRLRVPVDRLPERARIHAAAVGRDAYSVPDAVELRRDGDTVTVDRPYDPPAWSEDAVIYEIFVRTFADDADGQSTFDAMAERLPYLADLGVDVLWLTPVLQNDHAPHGYNIRDFLAIADDLGGRDDYERFLERAHEHGLRVLFDLVCNHSARTHPFFEDAVADPDSEYRDWYEWRDVDAGLPETYFEWEHIANFQFDTLAVRRHLLDAVAEWAPLVDGFRCDMAWAVPNGFWRELHDTQKERDGEFLLLDETIPYIPDYQAGLFDMHFDSTTYFQLREIGRENAAAETLLDAMSERTETGFPDHAAFMLYCENHDEGRYITECGKAAAKAAGGALFTLPGAPMLYAGQELGQQGRRDALVWEEAHDDLQTHYEQLIATRREEPALAHRATLDDIEHTVTDGAPDRVVAYRRQAAQSADDHADELVVVLNFGADPATVAVEPSVATTDVVSGTDIATEGGLRVEDVAVLPAG
jgi:glycosidase